MTPAKAMLTIEECAAYTGYKKQTILNKISSRTIPHYKLGKKPVFDLQEIIAWMKEKKVNTVDEIQMQANDYIEKRKQA